MNYMKSFVAYPDSSREDQTIHVTCYEGRASIIMERKSTDDWMWTILEGEDAIRMARQILDDLEPGDE